MHTRYRIPNLRPQLAIAAASLEVFREQIGGMAQKRSKKIYILVYIINK